MKIPTDRLIFAAACAAALVIAAIAITTAISNARTAKLEREAEAAKSRAETLERAAEKQEAEAARYREKIGYLEKNLADIGAIARKQDEELENYKRDVSDARGSFERAKRVRSIDATAEQLCAKLAELGHGCE